MIAGKRDGMIACREDTVATPSLGVYSPGMRFGLIFLLYLVVGVLVAAGILGSEGNYFSGLSDLEEIAEMVLAVLLWPLLLLDVIGDINIGGGDSGGGDKGGDRGGSGGADGGGKGK
jgi:hypothetical protein